MSPGCSHLFFQPPSSHSQSRDPEDMKEVKDQLQTRFKIIWKFSALDKSLSKNPLSMNLHIFLISKVYLSGVRCLNKRLFCVSDCSPDLKPLSDLRHARQTFPLQQLNVRTAFYCSTLHMLHIILHSKAELSRWKNKVQNTFLGQQGL